jgi:DNA-binding CsgD family transcriptional regulator
MPKLLSLLHEYIPSFANTYFWIEANGQIKDIYDEHSDAYAALPTYHEKFLGQSELEVWSGLSASAQIQDAVHMDQLWHIPRDQVLQHDFYKLFLRKVGNHWGLSKAIWHNDMPRGLLHLKRQEGEKDFLSSDLEKLDKISPYIAQTIADDATIKQPSSEYPIETAKLVVDGTGRIHNYTSKGERIMMLSQGESQIDAQFCFSHSRLTDDLRSLIEKAKCPPSGRASHPYITSIQNRWGKFKFSVFPLSENVSSGSKNLTILQIDHYVPIKLFIFERIESMDLTDRQFDICFEILEGKQYAEVANGLGLQESTVTSHKKEILRKAGVNTRHELSEKVFFGSSPSFESATN